MAFVYPFVSALSEAVRRVVEQCAPRAASMTLSVRLDRFVRDAFLPHATHDSGETLASAFASPDAMRAAAPGVLCGVADGFTLLCRLWRSAAAVPSRWSKELCRVLDDVRFPIIIVSNSRFACFL